MDDVIPRRVVRSVRACPLSSGQVAREFRRLLDAGARLRPAGAARRNPMRLLRGGYTPKHRIELFDTTFYLTNPRQNPDIRFMVAYVVNRSGQGAPDVYPRIFYKDVSLIWRSASHYVRSEQENWIGKGDVMTVVSGGEELVCSNEATTDLPLEMQTALEDLNRRPQRIFSDEKAVGLVLRRGPDDRIEPYRDFSDPRRRARSNPRNLVNRGRSIARFRRPNDPHSLEFSPGFEPDFDEGRIEVATSTSRLYGGRLRRHRILSRNREVQYLFMSGVRHVWIIPAQATTTELSSYGVRTIDVIADEDLFVPGFEYHAIEGANEAGIESQIPTGFAGEFSESDPTRADASPWLDELPVIQEFRRKVLGQRARARTR